MWNNRQKVAISQLINGVQTIRQQWSRLPWQIWNELRKCVILIDVTGSWGRSSDGRALGSHSRGQGFDPPRLHQ